MHRLTNDRQCRCGARLARDNHTQLCAACTSLGRNNYTRPPQVPAEFWQQPDMAAALDAWHMGKVIRAFRLHPWHPRPIAQATAGAWLHLNQTQLSRIETGPPVTDLAKLRHWAQVLSVPADRLWFRMPSRSSPREQPRAAEPLAMASAPALAQLSVGLPAVRAFSLMSSGKGVLRHEDTDASAIHAFRAADKQVGGGHLYATVIKYLHTEVAPRLFSSDHGDDGRLAFNGAAALTDMVGWMAHDAGRDLAAKRHFSQAHSLAQVGGDCQFAAHVLASLSHLAHHLDQLTEAVQFAARGREALKGGPPQPELEARLLAMQARGFAACGETDECVQLLLQAEQALGGTPAEEPSPWVSGFDEASLASETARCMRQLGDLKEAQRQAERIIQLRSQDRTRSRAFGQLILVTVLIDQSRPDEACAVAQDVLNATRSLSSVLVIQQLLDLKQLLEPHRANKVVADFLVCLDEALRERMWLYLWLVKDGRSQPTVGEDA